MLLVLLHCMLLVFLLACWQPACLQLEKAKPVSDVVISAMMHVASFAIGMMAARHENPARGRLLLQGCGWAGVVGDGARWGGGRATPVAVRLEPAERDWHTRTRAARHTVACPKKKWPDSETGPYKKISRPSDRALRVATLSRKPSLPGHPKEQPRWPPYPRFVRKCHARTSNEGWTDLRFCFVCPTVLHNSELARSFAAHVHGMSVEAGFGALCKLREGGARPPLPCPGPVCHIALADHHCNSFSAYGGDGIGGGLQGTTFDRVWPGCSCGAGQ
eukprot:gene23472-biopygen4335